MSDIKSVFNKTLFQNTARAATVHLLVPPKAPWPRATGEKDGQLSADRDWARFPSVRRALTRITP